MEFNYDKYVPDGYKCRDSAESYGNILLSYLERENRNCIVFYTVDYAVYRRKNSLFIIFYSYSFVSEKLDKIDTKTVRNNVNEYIRTVKSSNMQGIRSTYLNKKLNTFHIKDIINII